MAVYVVDSSNWDDPSFWAGISEASSGHSLDFSALGGLFSLEFNPWTGAVTLSDGTSTFTIGDASYAGGGSDASLGGATLLSYFTTVTGTQGNDTLHSSSGAQNLSGGAGDDRFVLYDGFGNDTIDGGSGTNTIDVSAVTTGVTVDYYGDGLGPATDGTDTINFTNIQNWELTDQADLFSAGGDTVGVNAYGRGGDDTMWGGLGDDMLDGGDGVDIIYGDTGDDTIYGGAGNDTIDGNTGRDVIYGGSGDDLVLARGGVDTTDGGAGTDTIDFTNDIGSVVFTMADGATTITGGAIETESNINYENAIGSAGNDSILGTAGANSIAGGLGNDTLTGGFGSDTFNSGGGNDSIVGSEDAGDGDIDVLDYSGETNGVVVTYTGSEAGTAAGTTTDTDTFSEIERIIFTNQADAVNALADTGGVTLDTQAGDDFVAAGQGADSLDGGADTDQLSYLGSAAPVTLDIGAGTGTGGDAEGDTFANFEIFNLTDGDDSVTGSTSGEEINAQAGNDNISTGGGDDSVVAGAGNDTVQGGAGADNMNGGAGIDTLSYEDSAAPVTVNLGANSVSGGDATGDTIAAFENVTGSAGGDVLTGSNASNTISGLGGDDQIDAGLGADSVDAGAGNDNVAGSLGDDVMDGGADNDTYDASGATGPVTIDLSNNTATGAGVGNDAITNFEGAVGGAFGDTFTGDGGPNTFDGGDGDDSIGGGAGNDSLDGSGGNDFFAYNDGDGNDTIVGGEDPGDTDNDTIRVQVPIGGGFDVVYSGGNDEAGQIFIRDSGGATINTVTFSEIENIVCFTRGTMIETPKGHVAIEDLSEGDMIVTRDNGVQPLRWIGSQTVKAKGKKAPVMIKAGALGNDRDLRVSQLHRMLITDWRAELMFDEPEVLAAAKHLVNGDTIYVEENSDDTVEYFHMLFDSHEIVTANGAASESFHPGEQGLGWMAEETREEIFEIFPELRVELGGYGDAARTSLKAYEAKALKR